MNGIEFRRLGLACVAAASMPACEPEGAGSIHVDRAQLKQYTPVPDRKSPEPRRAKTRPARALAKASVPGR